MKIITTFGGAAAAADAAQKAMDMQAARKTALIPCRLIENLLAKLVRRAAAE
jgi:hypothetical protein